mmetsp:Transcript_17105/g.32353  ORF Transcript_17105/g.32353 Transcript_17105/m.32353 type:complete len:438 (+) Transcript_17105:179-1492(+)
MEITNSCKVASLTHLVLVIFFSFSHYALAFVPSQKRYFKGRVISTELQGEKVAEHAIVIGGGPIGLASALMLANPPHCYNVTVYEESNRETTQSKCLFDPALAYLYNVNARGQTFTKEFPFVHENLIERSVAASQTRFVLSPANPDDDLVIQSVPSMSNDESYWIPRHKMVNLLQDAIDRHNNAIDCSEDGSETRNIELGRVEVQSGMGCIDVLPTMSSSGCQVGAVLENQEGDTITSCANLIVAADGIHSKVRQCLLEGTDVFAEWKNFKAKRFKVKKWISPASGLRLKALQLPANFTLTSGVSNDRREVTMQNNNIIAIRGLKDGPRDFLSLGCLPMTDDVTSRPANAITRPDHVLWTLKTGDEVQKWYEENFPRLSFQKEEDGGMISKAEWERFARAEGTTFPPCQYTPGLQASSMDGKCGIVLLGDSGKYNQT